MGTLPRPPNRQFEFHGTMRPSLGIYAQLIANGRKPPTHFHPHQWEFFRVLRGHLTVDLNGVPTHRTASDPELAVAPYTHHVVYGTPGTEKEEVEFVVSASDARDDVKVAMDQAFSRIGMGIRRMCFRGGRSWILYRCWR